MRKLIRFFLFPAMVSIMTAPSVLAAHPTAESASDDAPVVVIVKVAKPWYAPDFLVVRKMRAAIPQYQRIPGLTYKVFSIARPGGEFGGIYLWQDRASAEAWFDPAWYRRVKTERGVDADVRMFEAAMLFDKAPLAERKTGISPVEDAVATLVTLPIPAGMSRERILRGFEAETAIERRAPDLLRKYAIITGDGRFGGVYLWRDEASARRWFDTAWRRKVHALYGNDPQLEWFDAPILMPSASSANRDAERRMLGYSR